VKSNILFSIPIVSCALLTTAAAQFADLSNFAGQNNVTAEGNNYNVITQTSAGGTFTERSASPAYLADISLLDNGTTYTNASVLSATGTLTFDVNVQNTSTVVDPIFSFGYFNSGSISTAGGAGKFGFSFADQSTSAFRVQLFGGGDPVTQGTYTFQIGVNDAFAGAGNLRVQFLQGGTEVANEVAPAPAFTANAFGFVQPSGSSPRTEDFSVTVSDLNYTGQTLVPEPGTLSLALVTAAGMLCSRRRRS